MAEKSGDWLNLLRLAAAEPGRVFPQVLLGILAATFGVIVLHLVFCLLRGRSDQPHRQWNLWQRLVYLVTLAAVAILAVTSFYAVLQFGHMTGWWLFVHMVGAGTFVAVLPILALTWFRANRCGDSSYFFCLPKAMFWLVLLGGLVVVGTMLLSMFPLFGTDVLEQLLVVHRYAGLLVVTALILHLYAVLLQRWHLR